MIYYWLTRTLTRMKQMVDLTLGQNHHKLALYPKLFDLVNQSHKFHKIALHKEHSAFQAGPGRKIFFGLETKASSHVNAFRPW